MTWHGQDPRFGLRDLIRAIPAAVVLLLTTYAFAVLTLLLAASMEG